MSFGRLIGLEEIRPNLFRIEVPLPDSPLKFLNSYVIRSPDRNLVIDTGLNRTSCFNAMKAGLEELRIDPDRTDFYITHLHADHLGLVTRLISTSSRVYFNRPEAEIVKAWPGWGPMIAYSAENGFPEADLRAAIEQHPGFKFSAEWVPAKFDSLEEGDVIHVGDYHFKCISTPGHSIGHTCLYDADQKILVAGDHILIDITPNIQCWSDALNPLKRYFSSLDSVYDLDVDLVLPGHRRLIRDHRTRIMELKAHHHARCGEILGIIESSALSAYEIASRMTWDIKCDGWRDFPLPQKWFATGEAIAHLKYLLEEKRVDRIWEANQYRYQATNRHNLDTQRSKQVGHTPWEIKGNS
jgi:glyoxylase-like metal-dependent hydrolase (beta-lactamase superfamily II)